MIRGAIALTGAALALMLVMSAAAAAAPTIERNDLEVSLVGADCGIFGFAFTYDLALEGKQTITDFGDRLTDHQVWDGSATASTGITIRLHHSFTAEVDFVDNTLRFTGLPFGAWIEGSGIKDLERGRLVVDLTTGVVLFATPGFPFEPGDPFAPNPHLATCELIAAAQASA